MSKRLLIVEDDEVTYSMIKETLCPSIRVDWAPNFSSGQISLEKNYYDIVLLDVELPDGSGIDLCTMIQAKQMNTSVFFLSEQSQLSVKVLGFLAGADDYITKPFSPLELKVRVEAKFKKIDLLNSTYERWKWKEIEIDKSTQEVFVSNGENLNKIKLTALEFKLITYFARRPGQVISRDDILGNIWGADIHVYSRSVDTHISKLRKKLGIFSQLIESIHGIGYKFCPHS